MTGTLIERSPDRLSAIGGSPDDRTALMTARFR